jgi:predicted nuclease of predicted toxin-antitoxin system
VKFLIDNNLSPLLAEGLKAAGHDAVHLRDLGLQAPPDPIVLQRAQVDERSWYQLTRTSAACFPVHGRPARQSSWSGD